jgi:uroporphyrin-3 C-methyltransferase
VSDTPISDDPAPDATFPPPAGAPPPLTAAPRRRGGFGWLLLIVLIIAGALAWWFWSRLQDSERRAAGWQQQAAELQLSIEDLQAGIDRLARGQKALETRAADNSATNKVLREELLGMGERASLLEDAVARLADNRLRGEVMLRLNEAEFLLLLGEERLRLFGDVASAIQAYTLVDAALAGLDDPVLATLRQTLAQEILALRSVPVDPRPAARAQLAQLGAELVDLPPSRAGEVATTDATDSRLMRLLSQLVTVRRVSERDVVLGPVQRETMLAALRLQLELAQAALARPDPAAYDHALEQAERLAARLFDAGDQRVAKLRDGLRALRDTRLVPELPVLGATLQELRGLRATRSIGGSERALPPIETPAAPTEETPAEDSPAQDAAAPAEGDA